MLATPSLEHTSGRRTKMKTREHVCSECSKTFTRATILTDHLRAHEGTRPHECITCGRAFTRRWDLKSHAKIHEQSASYNCDACGARFRRKRDVLRHQQRIKGSRCRMEQTAPTQTDQDAQAADALAGLKHGVLEHNSSHRGLTRKERYQWPRCPLQMPENVYIAIELASIGHKPRSPHCECSDQSSPSLRMHLLLNHHLAVLCTQCNEYIQARGVSSDRSSSAVPECHNAACLSRQIPMKIFPKGPFPEFAIELPSEEDEPRSKLWVALLPWRLAGPLKSSDEPTDTSSTPAIIDLDRDTVSTGQVAKGRIPAPSKALPSLENSQELDWDGWDLLIAGFAQSSTPNLEILTVPAMPLNGTVSKTTAPPPPSAQEGNDQYQHITLQPSTLANVPAMPEEADPAVHDDFSESRPDLLKVIIDVTKYLQRIFHFEYYHQMSRCQRTIIRLFLARLDEVSKPHARVMMVHTDALWKEFDNGCLSSWGPGHRSFDQAFDQIMRPVLHWRRAEPTGHVMSAWVADSKVLMQNGCKSVACPCEKYLEILRPYGDCVTALRDYSDSNRGFLSFVAGDKIRLISLWEGQCIRTGQIGFFHRGHFA